MVDFYFDQDNKVEKLRTVLKEWLGTPYAMNCNIKGEGVDCGRFAASVMDECGAIGSTSFYFHKPGADLRKVVENKLDKIATKVDSVRNGDILLFNWGRNPHLGIFCDNKIYHTHKKVVEMHLSSVGVNKQIYKKKIEAFRI